MSRSLLSWGIIIFIFIIGILPILMMISSTFLTPNGLSIQAYTKLFNNSSLWISFQNSFLLATTVATLTTIIGTFLGILFSKTDLKCPSFWLVSLSIPLLTPPYIIAYGWYALIGRNNLLGELFFGFYGNTFILFCVYLPISILINALFIRQIDSHLEDVGLLFGSWNLVIRTITLPLMKPAILISFLLVFVLSISEFSVANFLHYDIFPLQSFIQFSAFYDFKTATIFTMPLILIVIFILLFEYLFMQTFQNKQQTRVKIIALKKLQTPLILVVLTFTTITIFAPLFGILHNLKFIDFFHTLELATPVLIRTLFYACIGAILLVLFGFFSAYIIAFRSCGGWRLLNLSLLFLFVSSSIVIAIAFILFYNFSFTNFIYASPIIIILGYLVKYLFLSTKIIEYRLKEIPSSLFEAAQINGSSWYKTLLHITLPLSKKSLFTAGVIGFIFSLKESAITSLVAPAGSATLPVYILTQMANAKESTIASLSLIMILTLLIPLTFLTFLYKKKELS